MKKCIYGTLVFLLAGFSLAAAAPAWPDAYNVAWDSPSLDAAGSMPLGNGELGANLWVEAEGGLRFYLSRNDSLSEVSQICKVGRVRVTFDPNPFAAGTPFRQELKLSEGVCEITGGAPGRQLKLRVFVEAGRPVLHVLGESSFPVTVKATVESWRTNRHEVPRDGATWTLINAPFPLFESADVFPSDLPDAVAWYHRNEESPAYESTMKVQSLESIAGTAPDPLLHRTFGGWLAGPGFRAAEDHALATPAPVKSFALRVAAPCAQTPTADAWLAQARKLADESSAGEPARRRTVTAWRTLWDRSWVVADGGSAATPGEKNPLRLGYDSNQQNRFPGRLGRTGAFGVAFSAAEIEKLAAGQTDTDAATTVPGASFASGFTLEAWIFPEAARDGRIFDKITAGGSDGFLFDTHPGDTLRLIVGNAILSAPGKLLKPGAWQHVAATFDAASGEMVIYHHGRRVAARSGRQPVGAAYALQRYMIACAGRGPIPIKFNGSIFTVEPKAMGKLQNPDWRQWGDCHWWQNVRFSYHAMLEGGDFDLMDPVFNLYEGVRPLCEARAQLYHGAQGCYFPETMTIWGTYANSDYGWNRDGAPPKDVKSMYWRYAWNQGPELVGLMLDRWDYTRDEAFLKTRLLPMAESVLKYFDTRFPKDPDGRIRIDPAQAVETYWYEVTNDTPTCAGLADITARLCALPEKFGTAAQRGFFARMKAACPAVPIEEKLVNGKPVRRIAPAQKYRNQRSNCENPELYAVWPFRLYGLGKPDLDAARAAYGARGSHNDVGWGYDGLCAALLGLTDEAARSLQIKCANTHPAYRWPATWGPNFDWLPDQDHGANLMLLTQAMLLQPDGDHLRLLPSWPKDWNVSFKLWAPRNTTVECVYRAGKIQRLVVTPAARRKDVIMPE
jgi:hypothetical protein